MGKKKTEVDHTSTEVINKNKEFTLLLTVIR